MGRDRAQERVGDGLHLGDAPARAPRRAAFGGRGSERVGPACASPFVEALLSTFVVSGGGWPLLVLAARSFVARQLNMFSLIALGVSTAYLFCVVALVRPARLPKAAAGAAGLGDFLASVRSLCGACARSLPARRGYRVSEEQFRKEIECLIAGWPLAVVRER